MFGLPRSFWFLWLGTLVNRLGGFVIPFLSLYLTSDRGFTVEGAGLVVGLWGIGSTLAGPIGGALADAIGRRNTLVGGLLAGAGAMLHLGAAHTPVHIAAAAFLLGLLGDLYRPAVMAAVADLAAPAQRTRAFGLIFWAINLGFAIAAVLAGTVARRHFELLFIGDAATSVACAAIIWLWVPESRPERPAGAGPRRGLEVVLGDGVFLVFVALSFVISMVFQQSHCTLPIDIRDRGLPPSAYGMLIALNGVLIVLLQPLAARVLAPYRRSRVMATAALLVGVGFGLQAFARTPLLYAGAIAVWTLGEIAASPIWASVVADLAPAELRGTYQGVFQLSWGLAGIAGPIVGAQVLGRAGSGALWIGCFAVGVAAAIGHLAIAGPRRRVLAARRAA